VPDDDLPAVLAEQVRDPDAETWKPLAGPLEWEERTESVGAGWTDGTEQFEGLAVRDASNEEAYISSTLYAPDLTRML